MVHKSVGFRLAIGVRQLALAPRIQRAPADERGAQPHDAQQQHRHELKNGEAGFHGVNFLFF